MKRFRLLLLSVLIVLMPSLKLSAQSNEELEAQAKETAVKILKAFQDRDADALKPLVSGVLKPAISPAYFEDEEQQQALKAVDAWDGTIRDIRYKKMPIPGNPIIMATVYFSDVSGSDKINVLTLSKQGTSPWVMFSTGFDTSTKAEFESMAEHIGEKPKAEPRNDLTFNIEPKKGDDIENVSMEKTMELIEALNKKNNTLTIVKKEFNQNDKYLEVEWTKSGYILHYSKKRYSTVVADEAVDLATVKKYVEGYMTNAENWMDGLDWHDGY